MTAIFTESEYEIELSAVQGPSGASQAVNYVAQSLTTEQKTQARDNIDALAKSIGSTANLPLITTTSGVITVGVFGTTSNTFCQGNDSRLSDARTPVAHNHSANDITSGTLAKEQQHAQVAYKDEANTWDQAQTIEGTLGPELVTNGNFATNLTGWSGANWSWSAGVALHSAGSTADLTQALVPTVGDTYKVTFTVTSGSAGYRARLYFGGSWSDIDDFDGTYTVYITATSADPLLFRPSNASFNGSVDNVSVKKITTAANSKIETPVDFVKKITVWDKIDFPDGHAIAIGHDAFRNNGTGQFNIPSSNIAVGYEAGKNTTIGQVTAVGYEAAKAFSGEGSVTVFGKWAGYTLGAESYVTLVGNAAGLRTQSGRTSAFGDETASLNTTGEKSAFGGYAAHSNTTGDIDAFGLDSQREGGSTCTGNASFGRESFYEIESDNNSGFGYKIGRNTTSGTITGVGAFAGFANVTGSLVLLGNHAGYGAVTANAPVSDTGGILIGNFANRSVPSSTVLTNYVGIGDGVLIDKSNQVKIGNSSIVETVLYGNVQIGSETDLGGYKLQVTGNAIVTGNLAVPDIRLNGTNLDGYVGVSSSSILYLTDWLTTAKGMTIDLATGAVTTTHTNTAAIGFGVGATADANFPFRALGSLNATYGFLVNNTSTGSAASSAILLESDAGQAAMRQYSIAHSIWPGSTLISSPSTASGLVLLTSGAAKPIDLYTNNTLRVSISDSGLNVTGTAKLGDFTVGTLPSAAANAGHEANATDSSVTTFGSTVAGGGSNRVKVYSNGTNWTVQAA